MMHEETHDPQNMLSRGRILTDQFDESGVIDVELEPGECTLHHFRLAHSSNPIPATGGVSAFCSYFVRHM